MKKRMTVLLLVLAMLLTMLSGCGTEAAESAAAPVSETVSTEASQPEAPVEEAPAAEASAEEPASAVEEASMLEVAVDPGIEKPAEYVLPLYAEPVEISVFYPVRSGTHPSKSSELQVFWTRVQENLGYKISWTEPYQSAASEQFNLVIAAGDFPHIIFESLIAQQGAAYTGGYDLAVDEKSIWI